MSYFFSDNKDTSGDDGGQGTKVEPSSSTNEGAGVSYDSPAKFRMNKKPTDGVFYGSPSNFSKVSYGSPSNFSKVSYGSPSKFSRVTNQPRSSLLMDSPVPWKKSACNVPYDFKLSTPVPGNKMSTPSGVKRRSSGEGDKCQQEYLQHDQRSYEGGEGGHVLSGGTFSKDGLENKGDSGGLMPSEKRQTNASQQTSSQSHSGIQISGLDKKLKVDYSDGLMSTQAVLEDLLNRQREQLSSILTQVGTAEENDQKILVTIRKVSRETSAYSTDLHRIKGQYQTRLTTVSSFLSKMPGQ